jgi:hypothetical protein
MILVAIAALNFGAIRVWYQLRGGGNSINNWVEALTYGTLPMANLLAVGIMIGLRRPEARPFLWGFVAFGATALAFFVPLAYLYTEEVVQPYVLWVLRLQSLKSVTRNLSPEARIPIFYSIATLLVGLPQLAFALIGGLLCNARSTGKLGL